MTLDEKVSQIQNSAAAIPRLGIPAYDYWNEGLHGSARSGYSTMFPQAIGMAATWDAPLVHQVADIISVEARAKYNKAISEGNHSIYYGLTIWSPNINIFRDPRWGRGQETYGEDPFLTGRLGVAFVSGLQGDDHRYLRAISTPKHFAVHSGPESTRHSANVNVSAHDLQDTYLPAFRAAVTEGHAQSLMCAYNAVDGDPACANSTLLTTILRKKWGFKGFITSDCGAVEDISAGHKFAKDIEQASVDAVRAGTDTTCGKEFASLTQAVHDGLISESEIDQAMKRVLLARFQLGLFDPAAAVPYAQIPASEIDSAEHSRAALKTARESMVLLKNESKTLPLKKSFKTVAVIGPNAASLAALEGNYNAVPSNPVNPLDGLRSALKGRAEVLYAQGSSYVESIPVPMPETVFRTAAGVGLRAEYFANPTFSGQPAVVRVDKQIDFDWNAASPAPNVPLKAFSVRWSGTLTMPAPGDYSFGVELAQCYPCNDAESYSISLDGKVTGTQAFEAAMSRTSSGQVFKVHFADTKPHELLVEYKHDGPLFGAGITLEWIPPAAALQAEAVHVAEKADIVVAFVGLSPNLEGEEMPVKVEGFDRGDRTDIKLPKVQTDLLQAVAKTGKPVVVVLMNGSAVAVDWAQTHAAAILEAWYPGQAGGTAIAETLLGDNNPAGRLPVTFYKSIAQLPLFDDYSMAGRTYRYNTLEPLYRFGDGLSYTQFSYTTPTLSAKVLTAGDALSVTTHITNVGDMGGDEVVEVYLTPPRLPSSPNRELVGFTRIHLEPKEGSDVIVNVDPRQLSQVDAQGNRAVLPGSYKISVGGHQPTDGHGAPFEITGTRPLPE